MQKILKLTNKILILNIIINGTSNGRLEILLNIKEDEWYFDKIKSYIILYFYFVFNILFALN